MNEDPKSQPELQLLTPQIVGSEAMIAADAIVAETFLGWERRFRAPDIGGAKRWYWRPSRNAQVKGVPSWQHRPPSLCGQMDGNMPWLCDSVAEANEFDFVMLTSTVINSLDEKSRAAVASFGKRRPNLGFQGQWRVYATPVPLACTLLLAEFSGKKIADVVQELFGPPPVPKLTPV